MKMRVTRHTFILQIVSALTIGVLSISVGHTHKGATGVVKERMDLMDDIGKNMKSIKAMVKGRQPYDAGKMGDQARVMSQDAEKIGGLFPENSIHGPSEALPAIWQDWPKFQQLAERLRKHSNALANFDQLSDPVATRPLVKQIEKSCRSCHTDFRKKKKRKTASLKQ